MVAGGLAVALYLAIALAAIFFCGYGVARLCGKGYSMVPIAGYALSQVLFFIFYFVFFSVDKAVVAVFATAALINLVSLRLRWVPDALVATRRDSAYLAGAGVFLLLIAAWPYFLAGWGNYWHSGNEDVFDALNGRDAFIQHDVALNEYFEGLKEGGWGKAAKSHLGMFLPSHSQETVQSKVAIYAGDIGRLQYSSTAFWSTLFSAKHEVDAWLIQALLCLLLMGYGMVQLFERVLPISRVGSIGLATVVVANNFYLSTYFNGHQGSLMFAAMLPFGLLLALSLLERREGSYVRDGLLLALILAFVLGAYPYPLPFFLLAVFIYWLLIRQHACLSRGRNLIGLGLLLLGFYIATWFLLEPIRERALDQFRSWGTTFNVVGFFQFWGIWPSMLASASSDFMNALVNSRLVMLASYAASLGLCGLAVYGLYRAARMKHLFLVAFAIMWLGLFPFMRFIVADSYYFYKFLYLNNFFVIGLVLFGYAQMVSGAYSKALSVSAKGLIAVWLALNIVGNAWAAWVISIKPYNVNAAAFRALIPALRDKSESVYFDLPKRGTRGAHPTDNESVARSYLWSSGLRDSHDPATAKYFLRMNKLEGVAEHPPEKVLWQSALFRLVEAQDANLITIRSFWAPEYDRQTRMPERDGRFRWVSDGDSNWLDVDILHRDADARYLHFCAASGPSVDERPVTLEVHDGAGNRIGQMGVERYGCHWVEVAGRRGPFRISSDVVGHTFSLIDTRHLNFRIFNVGVSNARYDLATLRYLNEVDDIVPGVKAVEATVYLGNDWHALERQSGEKFRWAQSGAELVLEGCTGQIALDIEPGPSLGRELRLSVRTPTGRVLAQATAAGRSVVKVPVDAVAAKERILKLMAESNHVAVPGDPRQLDFRVFGISCSPGNVK